MGRSGAGGGGGGFSGGGGRSGGFSGGGRSSGGFTGGSRGGRSGSSGSSRSRGSSSGYRGYSGGRGFRTPMFVPVGSMGRRNSSMNSGGGSGGGSGQRPAQGGGSGCLTVFIIALVVVIALAVVGMLGSGGGSVKASTVQREALPAGAVTETAYFTDEPGWISNDSQLISGLKQFYEQTGVQPYLYIADRVNGRRNPTVSELQSFAEQKYSTLFTDEAHFLLVFCDNGEGGYACGYSVGSQAKSVVDDEALGILADYLDRYYSDNMSDEQFFSTAFAKTAERMMTVTKSQWPTVLIVLGLILVIALLYLWWSRAKEEKRLAEERTKQILETPLQKFGDTEAEDLAKKYEDKDTKS